MEFADADAEQEELQRLSETYEPNVEGPLVSHKESISSLLTEYQHADQSFITKLTALSRDHSTYRAIKRDGKCGWTAAVFGYFETLMTHRAGEAKIQAEILRLQDFNRIIESVGISLEMVEFAMDATWTFMGSLHDHLLHGGAKESHLLETFNEEDQFIPNSIIYHFKLMTSAFMQANSETYAAFVDAPLEQYCRNSIEPQNHEIDFPGLMALASGVIAPGGINFDVLYLDRSSGEQVTTHNLGFANGSSPLIEVLYRPGHYDLIYKDREEIHVNFQSAIPEPTHVYANPGFYTNFEAASILAPESSLATGYAASMAPYVGGHSFDSHWHYTPHSFINTASTPPSHNNTNSTASTPPTDLSTVAEESSFPMPVSHHPTQQQHMPSLLQLSPRLNDPIRFNQYTYAAEAELPLATAVFKNSPFNPNHFRNQNFEPQEYHPHESNAKSRARRSNSTRNSAIGGAGTTRARAGAASGVGAGRRDSIKKLK